MPASFRIFVISFISLTGFNAVAEDINPTLSLDIVGVERHLINNNLIRIIQFNTENQPRFVIERLSRPSIRVDEKLEITELKLGERMLDFRNSAGVFIETVTVDKTGIDFTVYFVYPGKGGGSVDLACRIEVGKEKFSTPICNNKQK